jgi:NAD+-dependent protein deacetylase sirtuin 5
MLMVRVFLHLLLVLRSPSSTHWECRCLSQPLWPNILQFSCPRIVVAQFDLSLIFYIKGLSQLAGHPQEQLRALHGSLFDIKCINHPECDYIEHGNIDDPLCLALAPASEDVTDPTKPLPLLDPNQPLAKIDPDDLPHCPKCKTGLLRPGVVWFGEFLDENMLQDIDRWTAAGPISMVFSIGTSAQVQPAAGYIAEVSERGATHIAINLDAERPDELAEMYEGDFAFGEDAAKILPILLEPIIGKMKEDGTFA